MTDAGVTPQDAVGHDGKHTRTGGPVVYQDVQENRWFGCARLACDPVIYEAGNRVPYARVWITLRERRKKDHAGRRELEAFPILVTVLGYPARRFATYARKGHLCSFSGHLEAVTLYLRDGERRIRYQGIGIQAFQFGFLDQPDAEGFPELTDLQIPGLPCHSGGQ